MIWMSLGQGPRSRRSSRGRIPHVRLGNRRHRRSGELDCVFLKKTTNTVRWEETVVCFLCVVVEQRGSLAVGMTRRGWRRETGKIIIIIIMGQETHDVTATLWPVKTERGENDNKGNLFLNFFYTGIGLCTNLQHRRAETPRLHKTKKTKTAGTHAGARAPCRRWWSHERCENGRSSRGRTRSAATAGWWWPGRRGSSTWPCSSSSGPARSSSPSSEFISCPSLPPCELAPEKGLAGRCDCPVWCCVLFVWHIYCW